MTTGHDGNIGVEAAGCRALEQAFAESELHPERLGQMVADGESALRVLGEVVDLSFPLFSDLQIPQA